MAWALEQALGLGVVIRRVEPGHEPDLIGRRTLDRILTEG
jgi:hypothetical protein